MLMDNMGAGGGSSNGGMFFGAPEMSGSLGGAEKKGIWSSPEGEGATKSQAESYDSNAGKAELNENYNSTNSEKVAEVKTSGMPMNNNPSASASKDNDSDDAAVAEAKADLEGIHIKRDAEVLPKAYIQAVTKIINRDKKDPHRLVAELDVARWDMMSKAFNRKLGDGLNGGLSA